MQKPDVHMTAERSDIMGNRREHVMVQVGGGPMLASYLLTTREVENWIAQLRMALLDELTIVVRKQCRKCEKDCAECTCAQQRAKRE